MRNIKRKFSRSLTAILSIFLALSVFFVHETKAQPIELGKGPVVIHSAYGGGGNNRAKLKNDFIILQNVSDSTVDMSEYSIQYASAAKNNWNEKILTGTLEPGSYYKILAMEGNNKDLPLPFEDADYDSGFNISSTGFKVALVKSPNKLPEEPTKPEEYPSTINLVDFLGVSNSANQYLGTSYAPVLKNELMLERVAYDAENSTDYITKEATIENLAYLNEPVSGEVNKEALLAKLNEAKAIDGTEYVTETFEALQSAITAAQSVYDNEAATQDEVNAEVTKLQNAIGALEKIDASTGATIALDTIAEIRTQAKGETVKGSGTITFKDNRNLYLQDATAGIVYRVLQATADQYNVGDNIDFIGELGEHNQLKQVVNGGKTYKRIVINSKDNVVEPKEVTVSDLLNNGEAYESQLVLIKDATTGVLSGDNQAIHQNSSTINVYRGAKLPYAEGTNVNVKAVVTQFHTADPSAGYQLRIQDASWVTEIIPEGHYKIADARLLPEESPVIITGVITGIGSDRAWIQDETGAILLYRPTLNIFKVGDKVRVTGKTAAFNQLIQIATGATYEVLSSGNSLPKPLIKTPTEIQANLSNLESHKVILNKVTLTTLNTSGTSVFTGADGTTIDAYRMPKPTDSEIGQGSLVDVIGFVDNFGGTPQIRILSGDDITLSPTLFDPIQDSEIVEGITSLKDAQSLTSGEATLIGSVAYKYGGNSILIQDTIDGEIYGFQLYDYPKFNQYNIGDIVKVTGKVVPYGGVPQLNPVSNLEIVRTEKPYQPQILTIPELLAGKDNYLSEYVKVESVVLGTYSSNSNTPITDDSSNTINIYRGAEFPFGVEAGEMVHLLAGFSKYNANYQLRVGSSADYVVINDTMPPVFTEFTLLNPKVNEAFEIQNIEVKDNVGVASVTVTVNGGEPIELIYNAETGKYDITIPGSLITTGTVTLVFKAVDVNGLEATEEQNLEVSDKPEIKSVKPAPNTATKTEKQPVIEVAFSNAGDDPEVKLTLNDMTVDMVVEGEVARYTPSQPLDDGVVEAGVTITRKDGAVGVYAWKFTVGEASYNFYFGQIHSHTAEYSDGSGTLAQALEYARNAHQLDFFAVTDHSNYFDSKDNLGTFDNPQSGLTSKTNAPASMWQTYKEQINAANDDGTFVTFPGFEMTWSGGPGHINTFNTNGFVSRNNPSLNSKESTHEEVLTRYYALLKEQAGSFSMFNHPGNTFGTFNDFGYWDPAIDAKIKLLEVGNGEGLVGSSGYWPSYQYYTQALDKGWHLAPANGQDNHKGKWGDSNTTRTVVIADSLSRSSILRAINDLMVYSTEDDNFEVYFTANDLPMGSSFTDSPETIKFVVNMNDPDVGDNIAKLEVVSSGGIIAYSKTLNTNSTIEEFEIPNQSAYYYLRITQADGQIIVTAPVWTGSVTLVGIDGVSKDSAMETVNEPFNITTNLYNYEANDFVIEKMEYVVNEKVVHSVTEGLPIIPANGKIDLTHPVAVSNVGEQYLQVVVSGNLNGMPMMFNSSIRINVYDQSQIMKVGIDAFHDNFYISGDYSGSDANFIAVAAQSGAIVEHIREAFTLEKLQEYDLVIITIPYLGFGKGGKAFETAELEALKQYAAAGGNLVITSKSDRGDAANVQVAADVSNQLLEAVGAKARVASGIVVDNEKKSNEAYRLNFSDKANFNEVDELSEGIFSDTTGLFSSYNAAPILANGANEIVVGYPTTWGASYFANFNGSAYVPNYETDKVVVPMGEVAVVTTETLSGGGFLVTSGVTFFSTFEVKTEMLQDRDTRTANYRLVQNILNAAKPEATITPIAEVQAAEEGKFFTIEGILTSNASGYDTETAFFDSAYVQDETGGINIFPIAGNYQAGQKVRISGTTSSYNGEHQLNIYEVNLIDATLNPIEPKLMTTKKVKENLGLLVRVEGEITNVTKKDGIIESITVKDDTGEIVVFIDGYIMPSYLMVNIEVGNTISAVGLSSISVNDIGEQIQRIRVRNRSEVVGTPVTEEVDKSALAKLVETAEALDKADYTTESYQALEKALATAKQVLDDEQATQEQVDQAKDALQKAIDGLVKVEEPEEPIEVDKSLLAKLVETAETIDKADYTTESYQALEQALATARQVLDDEQATQEQIDQAKARVQEAIDNLVKVSKPVETSYILVDEATGVKVYVPVGAFESKPVLVVKPVNYPLKDHKTLSYDIYFLINGKVVLPAVEVTVDIMAKDMDVSKVVVYHVGDGLETVKHVVVGSSVRFTTKDFSVYVLAEKQADLPKTGHSMESLGKLSMLLLVGGYLLLRKRKNS